MVIFFTWQYPQETTIYVVMFRSDTIIVRMGRTVLSTIIYISEADSFLERKYVIILLPPTTNDTFTYLVYYVIILFYYIAAFRNWDNGIPNNLYNRSF